MPNSVRSAELFNWTPNILLLGSVLPDCTWTMERQSWRHSASQTAGAMSLLQQRFGKEWVVLLVKAHLVCSPPPRPPTPRGGRTCMWTLVLHQPQDLLGDDFIVIFLPRQSSIFLLCRTSHSKKGMTSQKWLCNTNARKYIMLKIKNLCKLVSPGVWKSEKQFSRVAQSVPRASETHRNEICCMSEKFDAKSA